MIEGADFVVRITMFPHGVHGCVSEDSDGFYNIYINSRDSYHRQMKAIDHELRHILNRDFSKSDVREIEGL